MLRKGWVLWDFEVAKLCINLYLVSFMFYVYVHVCTPSPLSSWVLSRSLSITSTISESVFVRRRPPCLPKALFALHVAQYPLSCKNAAGLLHATPPLHFLLPVPPRVSRWRGWVLPCLRNARVSAASRSRATATLITITQKTRSSRSSCAIWSSQRFSVFGLIPSVSSPSVEKWKDPCKSLTET